MPREGLRAKGDLEFAELLLQDPLVRKFQDEREKRRFDSTRRHLLGTAVRLTSAMTPSVLAAAERCRATLEIEEPLELFVMPDPRFNAFSFGSLDRRLFVGLTSSLLEAFDDDELRFVIGHEMGHYKFRHHDIPVGALLHGDSGIRPKQAIQLFRWQRYAEISADRAGLVCVGSVAPTLRAFFKIASGLRGDRITFDIDGYVAQIGDIESEAAREREHDDSKRPRADWFSSHPFSPLRVRAVQLCGESSICVPGGTPIDELERRIQALMALMEPNYLVDEGATGVALRQLFFAGAVMVAAAHDGVDEKELAAIADFLGEANMPPRVNAEALRDDLQRRIERVRDKVPQLLRSQVIRDLCVVALADGCAHVDEIAAIHDLAARIDVDPMVIESTIAGARCGLD